MILIADSGSTKTDWCLCGGGLKLEFTTQGINPFHQGDSEIVNVLEHELIGSGLKDVTIDSIDGVYFYGSGCTPEQGPRMKSLLTSTLGSLGEVRQVECEGDMLGAARSLCGHSMGIACILGTGANSCLYDGNRIVANTPPLGYILGDEGSGAYLGRHLLNAIIRGRLGDGMRSEFYEWAGLIYPQIISKVYRQPLANRFLASLVPFIQLHIDNEGIREIVEQAFAGFIENNVRPYGHEDLPLNFIGGIAWSFRSILEDVAGACGRNIGTIAKRPMDGLVRYHGESNCA